MRISHFFNSPIIIHTSFIDLNLWQIYTTFRTNNLLYCPVSEVLAVEVSLIFVHLSSRCDYGKRWNPNGFSFYSDFVLFEQSCHAFQCCWCSSVFATQASKTFMHDWVVFLMPVVLIRGNFLLVFLAFVQHIGLFSAAVLSLYFRMSLVLLSLHHLTLRPVISSRLISITQHTFIGRNAFLPWSTAVIKLRVDKLAYFVLQKIDCYYGHVEASCLVHVVGETVRTSVVGVL